MRLRAGPGSHRCKQQNQHLLLVCTQRLFHRANWVPFQLTKVITACVDSCHGEKVSVHGNPFILRVYFDSVEKKLWNNGVHYIRLLMNFLNIL